MLRSGPLFLLVIFHVTFMDTYHNGFGIACKGYQSDCAQDKCIFIGRVNVCTQCKPSFVPINGKCVKYPNTDSSMCVPDDPSSPTRCIKCNSDKNAFLFYGGCYTLGRNERGSDICLKASGGNCVECKEGTVDDDNREYVFTNPDINAAERCILCSDSIGFGRYKGVDNCLNCMRPINSNVDVALCFKCNSIDLAPIDYQCKEKGPHTCRNCQCTACYKTHLSYHYGCYNKNSVTGLSICAKDNQYELDDVTICTKCSNSLYAPRNGACTVINNDMSVEDAFFECTKDESRGRCTGCLASGSSFHFYGGCYDRSSGIGAKLCSEIKQGKCKEWNDGFEFIFKKIGKADTNRYLCGSTIDGGVPGCATCKYDSGVKCTRYLEHPSTNRDTFTKNNDESSQNMCSGLPEDNNSEEILACRR